MGQRLVVTVVQDNKDIAKIYYHWSAYSVSALEETRDILNCLLDDENPIKDLRLRLIRFVESKGGCIDGGEDSDEFKMIQEKYPNEKFSPKGSRNNGLIALSKDGMDSIQGWSEGDVTINLDDERIYNEVYWADEFEYYKEQWDESRELKLEDIVEYNVNIYDFGFDEIDSVVGFLESLYHKGFYEFRTGTVVYQLIA